MRALLILLSLSFVPLFTQTEYVIVQPGASVYHRPDCEVVRDAKDVVAMTRAQAEARGLKPHPACDPANDTRKSAPAVVYVYVRPGGTHYHREQCDKVGKAPTKMKLDEAAQKFWPCPVCKPPIRKRGGA
jgi:hypothetical protein